MSSLLIRSSKQSTTANFKLKLKTLQTLLLEKVKVQKMNEHDSNFWKTKGWGRI